MTSDSSKSADPAGAPVRRCVDVAIAIVFDGAGKLLICKRKADAVLGGYWEFPGGKCGMGERPADCAVREVEEETGLGVAIVRAMALIEHDYPHARVRLHPFVCRWTAGSLELRAVAEGLWVVPTEVGDYRFPEANGSLLEAIMAGAAGPD